MPSKAPRANQTTITRVPSAAERARLKDGVHIEISPRRVRAYLDNQILADSQQDSRVDTVHSSRHVRVEVGGQVIAETKRPVVLYETGLPTRYYIPKLDVRMDLLESTHTITHCPYKGDAVYWSLKVGAKTYPDFVWSYPHPIPEIPKIENLLCFYNEKVDLFVDGVLQEPPVSPFS